MNSNQHNDDTDDTDANEWDDGPSTQVELDQRTITELLRERAAQLGLA